MKTELMNLFTWTWLALLLLAAVLGAWLAVIFGGLMFYVFLYLDWRDLPKNMDLMPCEERRR